LIFSISYPTSKEIHKISTVDRSTITNLMSNPRKKPIITEAGEYLC